MGSTGGARHSAPGAGARPVLAAEAETPPADYVTWPLWFVGGAFIPARRAGATLIIGLLLNVIFPSACRG